MSPASTHAVAEISSTARLLEQVRTERGDSLMHLVDGSPVLLVFLRHAGCTFCREAVADIAAVREEIEGTGTRIVLVHMGDRDGMSELIDRHQLGSLDRICDPDRLLYAAFGLRRGTFRQLFGLKVWVRGLVAGLIRGHGWKKPVADSHQMPGVFLLERGMIARSYRHRSAADRPCYTAYCADDPRGSN